MMYNSNYTFTSIIKYVIWCNVSLIQAKVINYLLYLGTFDIFPKAAVSPKFCWTVNLVNLILAIPKTKFFVPGFGGNVNENGMNVAQI